MKIAKRLLPLLLFVLAVLGIGCSLQNKAAVEEVITEELDLLKDLDSDTAQKYISYKTLFPDVTESTTLSTIVQEVFSLYFQDFDYKILDIDVDNAKHHATAKLRLTTLDSKVLARDFAAARLEWILHKAAAYDSQDTEDSSCSLEDCYQIMYELLCNHSYETKKTECSLELRSTDEKNENWEIISTSSFENDLVGGLLTYLSDTSLLSPEDTLSVYFQTLKHMTSDEMSSFLGVESILNSSDSVKNKIASALVNKVHSTFDYEILNCTIDGYTASIETNITTFDSDSILVSYQEELAAYMSTPDAVYDGSVKRYEKSVALLLEKIENCEELTTASATFRMIHDGSSWKLNDNDHILGDAIFGTLSTSPVDSEETAD